MISNSALSVAGTGLVHSLGGKDALAAVQQGETPVFSSPDVSSLAALLPGVSLRRIPRLRAWLFWPPYRLLMKQAGGKKKCCTILRLYLALPTAVHK